jgi:hypothetical protein
MYFYNIDTNRALGADAGGADWLEANIATNGGVLRRRSASNARGLPRRKPQNESAKSKKLLTARQRQSDSTRIWRPRSYDWSRSSPVVWSGKPPSI